MGRRLASIAGALYVLSLVVPALAIEQKPLLWGNSHDEVMFGMHCLLLGIFVVPAWLANPLMFVAWIFYAVARDRRDRYVVAAWLAGCATVSALIAPAIVANISMLKLLYPHVGYYLWVASTVCFAVGAALRAQDLSKRTPTM